ncbi:hypothetical protein XENOCAPTIV_010031, partial [Xenoophorus captivus]
TPRCANCPLEQRLQPAERTQTGSEESGPAQRQPAREYRTYPGLSRLLVMPVLQLIGSIVSPTLPNFSHQRRDDIREEVENSCFRLNVAVSSGSARLPTFRGAL